MDLYLPRESILVLVRMSASGKPEMQDRHPLEPFGSRTMLRIGAGGRYAFIFLFYSSRNFLTLSSMANFNIYRSINAD